MRMEVMSVNYLSATFRCSFQDGEPWHFRLPSEIKVLDVLTERGLSRSLKKTKEINSATVAWRRLINMNK